MKKYDFKVKYGYEIIYCSKLDISSINQIDEIIQNQSTINKKIAIRVPNTKFIKKEALPELQKLKNKYNLDIKISIIGPYDDEKQTVPEKKERYFYNTLYEISEMYAIIDHFEIIESRIDPQWSQLDIVVYLIETITRNIMYDPEYYLMYLLK